MKASCRDKEAEACEKAAMEDADPRTKPLWLVRAAAAAVPEVFEMNSITDLGEKDTSRLAKASQLWQRAAREALQQPVAIRPVVWYEHDCSYTAPEPENIRPNALKKLPHVRE